MILDIFKGIGKLGKKVLVKKAIDSAAVGGVVGAATFVGTGAAEAEDPVLTAALALAAALIRFIFLLRKEKTGKV